MEQERSQTESRGTTVSGSSDTGHGTVSSSDDKRDDKRTVRATRVSVAKYNKKPLRISRWLAAYPCRFLWALLALQFLITAVVVGGGFFEVSGQSRRDYLIADSTPVIRADTLFRAEETLAEADQTVAPLRSKEADELKLILIYRSLDGNILTPEHLETIRKHEQYILQTDLYPNLCFAGTDSPNCSPDAHRNLPQLYGNATTQAQVDAVTQTLVPKMNTSLSAFFARNFAEDGNTKSEFTRSFFEFGTPLDFDANGQPYRNSADRADDQEDQFAKWLKPVVEYMIDQDLPGIEFVMTGPMVFDVIFDDILNNDMVFAVGSVMFVLLYVTFHTKSIVLSSFGVFGIIMAFPITFFVYRLIFGIAFFQTLHMLTIFVILGIGADDIFVFVDAWNQAPVEVPAAAYDLLTRVDFTYRRASKAMFVTSVTTVVAFLATSLSPIMPIASFGIFAALLVAINYLIVITLFPCMVVIWQLYSRGSCCWRRNARSVYRKSLPADESNEPEAIELDEVKAEKDVEAQQENDNDDNNNNNNNNNSNNNNGEPDTAKYRHVERFCHDVWANQVYRFRYPILIIFSGWFVAAIVLASRMAPLSEQEEFLPDDHWFTKSRDYNRNAFRKSTSDNFIRVTMTWGLSGLDRSDTSFFDVDTIGEVIFDDDFDLSSTQAQQWMLDTCGDLRLNERAFQGEVRCFMEGYSDWRVANLGAGAFPANFSSDPVQQRLMFDASLADFANTTEGLQYDLAEDMGIDIDGKLRFVSVEILTDQNNFQPYSVTNPQYEYWDQVMLDINSNAPAVLSNGQQSSFSWTWMYSERAFRTGAIQGLAIAVSVALVVLIVSTLDVLIGFMATVNIAGIVASVTACMHLQGWELGVTESISMVILVGFSVDYVVHLANSYTESHRRTRRLKMQEGLREMGISVVAGAVTTFGASLFLWGCQTVFFLKFAALMGLTVAFSLTWSMFFFVALAQTIGPETDMCSVKRMFNCCTRKCGCCAPCRCDEEAGASGVEAEDTAKGGKQLSSGDDLSTDSQGTAFIEI